jgi:hypothetical protein
MGRRRMIPVASAFVVLLLALPTRSEDADESESALARMVQNPVADLISLPLQNNTSYNVGPRDRTQNVLNIQPVIPFSLGEDWNLITRSILPIVSQPSFARGQDRQNGVGDLSLTSFLSPRAPLGGWLIWGLGPVFNVPTASDDRLGYDKWGGGVSAVGLTMLGPVVAGGLVSNTWNMEGRNFSNFVLQPFLNYNLPDGWYLASSPIITANWEDDHNAWTVPVGGGLGKVHRFGKVPVNLSFQAFYNAETTKYGADWSTRFQVQLLFPK